MIIGQDRAVDQFSVAWRRGALHHAWLLAGPKGVGKATFARKAATRILAEAAGPAVDVPGLDTPEDHRIARLVEASDHLEMRILGRDANRDLMDAHLSGSSRSIPIVIVYDDEFREKGWLGPRPGPLQEWVTSEGLALPKPDRYPLIRGWYARDKGKTTVSEILAIIETVDD